MIEIVDPSRVESNLWHDEVHTDLANHEEFASLSMGKPDWYLLLAAAWEGMQLQQPAIFKHAEVWPLLQKAVVDVFGEDTMPHIQLRQDPDPRGCHTWDLVDAEHQESLGSFSLGDGSACSPYQPEAHVFRPLHMARALSQQAAYPAASRTFYSLAQRAVLAAQLVPRSDKLLALTWSYPKALLGHVAEVLRNHPCMAFLNQLQWRMFEEMRTALGISDLPIEDVKHHMGTVLRAEQRDLFQSVASAAASNFVSFPPPLNHPILPLLPAEAEEQWLNAFAAACGDPRE